MQYGIEKARRMATTKAERTAIDAAAAVLPESAQDLAIGSLAVTTLPHKGGAHITRWEQERNEATYIWQGGVFDGKSMGVPYGAKGRMVLIHLLTEAARARSLIVRNGLSSVYEWAHAVTNNAVGGTTYKVVLEHSRRIAVSRMAIIENHGANPKHVAGSLDDTVITSTKRTVRGIRIGDGSQPALQAPDFAVLNEGFYRACRRYSVPVRLSGLRQLSNNSAAINLYLQLGWYLPRLRRPWLLSWFELVHQFGTTYKQPGHMKLAFIDTLRLVLAVYREAKVELVKNGLLMYPGPAPISQEQSRDLNLLQDFAMPMTA